jgi:hypothetical protein
MNANFSTKSLFFISVTGLLLFSITTSHPQVGLGQKNESKLTSSDDMPAVTMDSCRDAVGKPLSKPIALLFVAACLAFAPTVFKMEGDTLGLVDKSGGVDPFQAKPDAAGDDSSASNQDDSTTNGDDTSGDQSDDGSASDNDDSSGDPSNDNSNDDSSS